MSIRLLTVRDVQAIDPSTEDVLIWTEEAYRLQATGRADVPTKIGVRPDRAHSFSDAMPAWVGGMQAALGLKWVSYFPGNSREGLADSSGLIILNDPACGHPVCIMEGMHITYLRTSACAALMARHYASMQVTSLGLVGCGDIGRWALRFLIDIFPSLKNVYVASKTSESRRRFCEAFQPDGAVRLIPVDHVQQAVENCDIVVSSIPPTEVAPIAFEWFKPNAVFIPLDLTHSWQAQVLHRADMVVSDNPAFLKMLLAKHRPDVEMDVDRIIEFQKVLVNPAHSRQGNGFLFLAVCGIASTDVMIGWNIYKRAQLLQIGTEFNMFPDHQSEPGIIGREARPDNEGVACD